MILRYDLKFMYILRNVMPKSTDRNRATLNGDDNKNEDLLQKQVQDISLGAQALRQQEDALRDSLKEKASEEKSKAEQKEDPQKINNPEEQDQKSQQKEEIVQEQNKEQEASKAQESKESLEENKKESDKATAKTQAQEPKSSHVEDNSSKDVNKTINSLKGKTSMLTALSVLILLGLGGTSYYTYNSLNALKVANSALESKIQEASVAQAALKDAQAQFELEASKISSTIQESQKLQATTAKLLEDNQALREQLAQIVNQGSNAQASLASITERLASIENHDPNQWKIAESVFCIKNAYLKAIVGNDIQTAIWNLNQADKIITGIENDTILQLRRAIAKDIAELEVLPKLDLFGLRENINNLIHNIDTLTIKGFSEKAEIESSFAKNSEPTSSIAQWKENLLNSAKEFSSRFVEIRRRNPDNLSDFISPSAELFLRENIKTRLVMALSNINTSDDKAYKENILEALRMVEAYFNAQSAQPLVERLQSLANENIVSKVPNTLESYAFIDKLEQVGYFNQEAKE